MIFPFRRSPPKPERPESSGDRQPDTIYLQPVLRLLDEALTLTRRAVKLVEDSEPGLAVELLARRDRHLTQAGEHVGRLSGTGSDVGADPRASHAHDPAEDEMEALAVLAGELGRLDARISAHLHWPHPSSHSEPATIRSRIDVGMENGRNPIDLPG